jgi:hypothetical protein
VASSFLGFAERRNGSMRIAFEQSLLQNEAFSATMLAVAVKSYYDQTDQKHGMPFLLSLLVLPLIYHRETAQTFAGKRKPSILPKVLAENRDLPLGVQERMQKMLHMSMAALRLAVASRILSIDDDGKALELVPAPTMPAMEFSSKDTKLMNGAARAIGHSFAEVTLAQLGEFLLVRF